ncbi:MAG: branched-chain amino acid ABC transporter permease [Alphaproteobacteria bacterium]
MDDLAFALIVNTLTLGAAYTLVAVGFVVVLNAAGAVNFAHGDLVMAGGYAAIMLAGILPLPALALLPAVVAIMAILGLALSLAAYFPIASQPPTSLFVSTIAVGAMLQHGTLALFGAEPRTGPPIAGGAPVVILGASIGRDSLVVIGAAVVLVGALAWFLYRTQIGRALRATAQDRDMARAIGIRVHHMIALAFMMGAAFAGVAGLLLAPRYFMSPAEGGPLMLKAYIAATLGGWGRIGGAVIGALTVAAFQVLVSRFVSYTAAEALLYGAILLVLVLRPQGLFGDAAHRRA